jgi:hypothetical protein
LDRRQHQPLGGLIPPAGLIPVETVVLGELGELLPGLRLLRRPDFVKLPDLGRCQLVELDLPGRFDVVLRDVSQRRFVLPPQRQVGPGPGLAGTCLPFLAFRRVRRQGLCFIGEFVRFLLMKVLQGALALQARAGQRADDAVDARDLAAGGRQGGVAER